MTDAGATQLTLIAHYGAKPPAFAVCIAELQALATEGLGAAFAPYDPVQVHGTIVGLLGERSGDAVYSVLHRELRGARQAIDFGAMFDVLRDPGLLPITVRIGGYAAARTYPAQSRGQPLHLRSFQVRGGLAAAMGWPRAGDGFPMQLDALRRALERAGVLHKYFTTPDAVDNDFYFVLGRVAPDAPADRVAATEAAGRDRLAQRAPFDLVVDRAALSIVAYRDPRLLPESTVVLGLDEAERRREEWVEWLPPATDG